MGDMQEKRGIVNTVDELSSSSRGMSPLIATVLLVAFAVALGAMIINLGSNIGENSGPDCSKVKIAVPAVCYAQNMIRMTIKNTGEPIESLTLIASDGNDNTHIQLGNSKLDEGQQLNVEKPMVKTATTTVSLQASVKENNAPKLCSKPSVEMKNIPEC
jgi:flagellin-like protein